MVLKIHEPGLYGFGLGFGFLCCCTYDAVCSSTCSIESSQLTANKLTAKQRFCHWFCCSHFVTKWGFGKIAVGIVKIYLESQFSASRRCSRLDGSWSVVVDPIVCHTTDNKCMISVTGIICDTAACEKIDFYKRTHIVIPIFNLIARYRFLITNVAINCTCCIRYLFPHFLTC